MRPASYKKHRLKNKGRPVEGAACRQPDLMRMRGRGKGVCAAMMNAAETICVHRVLTRARDSVVMVKAFITATIVLVALDSAFQHGAGTAMTLAFISHFFHWLEGVGRESVFTR